MDPDEGMFWAFLACGCFSLGVSILACSTGRLLLGIVESAIAVLAFVVAGIAISEEI